MAADSKNWAKSYVLDPLSGPDPSDETGPGSHFRSTFAPATPSAGLDSSKSAPRVTAQPTSSSTTSTNPFRRSSGASAGIRGSYPTPPASASPRRDQFPGAVKGPTYASENGGLSPSREAGQSGHRRRSSSLNERYPGDQSVHPLDMIRKDSLRAHRSPHMRKKNFHGTDVIDKLDPTGSYHHESAYDAASVSRNRQTKYSPIAALKTSNEEALKATPQENIVNAVDRHHPLEGTAMVPPGMQDRFGRTYEYEEGTDMMRDMGGNYKRWPGVQYHPDDLKGKGEPSYSIEKALKDHKAGADGIEMKTRSRNKSLGHADGPANEASTAHSAGVERSNTTGRRVGSQLKRRLLGRKG